MWGMGTGETGALLFKATAIGISRSFTAPSPLRSAKPKSDTRMTVPVPKALMMPCAE